MRQRLLNRWRDRGVRTMRDVVGAVRRATVPHAVERELTPHQVVEARFPSLSPLLVRHSDAEPRRLNLVTDTINVPHLYGGVGTALILGSILAEQSGRELRIVTRTAAAHEGNVGLVMSAAGVDAKASVSFAFMPDAGAQRGPAPRLAARRDDIYLTTSWWTTHATLGSVDPKQIVYLLQEDERMFYPYGDEHLRCAEILANPTLRFVVNTKLLYDHLLGSGLGNLERRGTWFEPSFPVELFHDARTESLAPPYRFLYYARPNNTRNLFYRGLEAIEAAIERGVLDDWELYFAGKDIPKLALPRGVRPRVYQNLSWHAYAAMVRKIDMGLCLMYTPHPSYPPLDLAASGAVAVTNRFAGKVDLSSYSANIVCADLDTPALLEGITRGAAIARDRLRRVSNFRASHIGRDWRKSFAAVGDALSSQLA